MLSYDAAGDLTNVAYPNGTSLQYTYSDGQRTQMVELSGATVIAYCQLHIRRLGQLAGLTDGSGNLIVSYTYNVLGELMKETRETARTQLYLQRRRQSPDLTNYAADGSVDSSFPYTYSALGQVTTGDHDGTWTYSYDALGELTGAVFTSTNPSIPSQNLSYAYNASGDRTQTIVNGATSTYTSNSSTNTRLSPRPTAPRPTLTTQTATWSRRRALGHDDLRL